MNGTSKNYQKRYLVLVGEDYQEEAHKRKVGMKEERKTMEVKKRRVRNEIVTEVMKGIQKMDVDGSVGNEGKRIGGQDLKQRWGLLAD